MSNLTNREWNQVRAALKFWRAVAEVSRQHPSAHPSVSDMFTEYGPMNLSEIDALLENVPEQAWLTAQKLANAYGVSRGTVDRLIKEEDISPDLLVGQAKIYRAASLMPVAERLERNG